MIDLAGKVAVITGGASGIGLSTVEVFIEAGARVAVADLDVERGSKTAQRFGESAEFFETDVSSLTSVSSVMAAVDRRFGQIDVLVNNAGVQTAGTILELPESEWDRMFRINPKGCFLATKAAVPYLRAGGGGSIVNVSSVAGIKGGPGMSAYAASKGAIIALSSALGAELAPDNIRVNCVCPGWIDTPFNDPVTGYIGGSEKVSALVESSISMRRQGLPVEAARAILFLASDASSYMTSQRVVVDGGGAG